MTVAGNLCLGNPFALAQGQGGIVGVAVPGPAPVPTVEPALQQTFDIDFHGGTPVELADAVEKASKMPLNVIVPERHRDFYIPPVKLRNVTVPQLFEGITKSSFKSEYRRTGRNNVSVTQTTYGFRMADNRLNTNTVWYFFVEAPPEPLENPDDDPICRFWQMEPYLQGLHIEDITTAIETGWKMLGVSPLPRLNFHKDTKLLIVVGPPLQLALIDDVLRQLTPKVNPVSGVPAKPIRNEGEKPSRQ